MKTPRLRVATTPHFKNSRLEADVHGYTDTLVPTLSVRGKPILVPEQQAPYIPESMQHPGYTAD